MRRDLWNRFMITLMAALIIFCGQQLWRSVDPENASRYWLSIGIAIIVIVLKIGEIKRTESGGQKPSQV
ncbi:MAG: hypothetical protein AB7G75_01095 [Candidatus Binatia bacterium]